MPGSSHHSLSAMLEHVVRLQPQTVLDIGVGFGKLGLLVRESLDWLPGRREKDSWRTRITGVEAYEGYTTPLYDWVYDEIVYADAQEYVRTMPSFDLAIMADVLEHFTPEDGDLVLDALLAKCRNVLISTPVDFYTQEVPGNPWEEHKSLWRIERFRRFGAFDYEVVGHTAVVVLLAGAGASYPTRADKRLSMGVYRLPGMTHQGVAARGLKQLGKRARRVRSA